jgi:hypothetical protein
MEGPQPGVGVGKPSSMVRDEVGLEPSRFSVPERRLIRLIEEFRERERRCPNLVVRSWFTPSDEGMPARVGCVIEYCPDGRKSVEVAVRQDRVTVDGPASALEAVLDLTEGWVLDGRDTRSPETLANYLLRMADRALGEAA